MPTSDKQLAANRANAAKSTGPRTPEGKARSSQNARTHGFTASTFAVVRIEDVDEIAQLRANLIAVYQPVNSQELFALESMALAQHEMRRVARLGSGVFTACLNLALNDDETPFTPMHPDLVGDGDIEITRDQNRNYALANGFRYLAKKDNTFPLFLRYQAQAERLYRRALEEFDRLKALRPELPKEPIFGPQPEENEPVSTPPEEPISPPQSNPEPGNRGADDLVVCASRDLSPSPSSHVSRICKQVGQAVSPAGPFQSQAPQNRLSAILSRNSTQPPKSALY